MTGVSVVGRRKAKDEGLAAKEEREPGRVRWAECGEEGEITW